MKQITVYGYRAYDEKVWFDFFSKEYGIKLVITTEAPTLENAELARGSECITILTSLIDQTLMKKFHELGVRFISTRTIGYDHIDEVSAREYGVRMGNATYGPDGVADYTVMLMLMSIRKMKMIMQRFRVQDFTLKGLIGNELKDYTIGVIGTGRIGQQVIQSVKGFGCNVLAYDLYKSDEVAQMATYVSLETIWKEADLITLHMPSTDSNFHLLNEHTFGQMKNGVIIINTARGDLIDTKHLLEALQNGKVGAAGLDVVEDEHDLYYKDCKSKVLENTQLGMLNAYPNVTITHHMAFYTDNAVKQMVGNSLRSCMCFLEGKDNPWEVNV